MSFRHARIIQQTNCSYGVAGIVNLMPSLQLRQAEVKQAIFILEDQAPVLFKRLPILICNEDWSPDFFSDALNFCPRFIGLHANNCRYAVFQDACLFMGDGGQRVSKILLVIIINGGDDRKCGLCNYICCIEPAAQTHFKNEIIGRGSGESQKCGGGCDFKECNWRIAIGNFTFFQQSRQFLLSNCFTGHIDALMKFHEVGRGVAVNFQSRLLKSGFDVGNGRTLAVGSRHMNDWRQFAFRISQPGKNPLHALKAEIDDLGMQRQEPVQYGITARQDITRR